MWLFSRPCLVSTACFRSVIEANNGFIRYRRTKMPKNSATGLYSDVSLLLKA